ncbi:hypothetical protein ID866_4809 [Astraeus odoratus]|nr:hypothetical protein ID866_4809 [Astraeus odoratus]
MFKSAATKIAHSTTIPALAGANPDLRQLQDLITAEKSVLVSLQRLSNDLSKASEALRAWGQVEGDDLSDILTASTTILSHFSGALTTWASLHHTVRDNMKAVRTREEALDEQRRRRKRVGASAEAAEKKLHKMSPEHKNLSTQTDTLNRLREEMRAMDGEIMREEAALSDFKRKCTKNWMTLKFGGLAECCEKGLIVADMGKCIVKEIPEDVTAPGLPRAPFAARGRVSDYVSETQQAVLQVKFSSAPSGRKSLASTGATPGVGDAQNQLAPQFTQSHVTPQHVPSPPIGGDTLGRYGPPPSQRSRSTSIDELGVHRFTNEGPQSAHFSTHPSRGRDPVPTADAHSPLSLSTIGNGATGEEQSLMASISDALARAHGTTSVDQTTSIGHGSIDPVPKYEAVAASEGHGYSAARANTEPVPGQQKRAARRSTSPPVLPPGAAPAAIRAWDDGMGQGEDGAHSDRPASSSERASQQRISSSEADGEDEVGLAYDEDDPSRATERTGNSDDGRSKIGYEPSIEGSHEHEVNMSSPVDATPLEPPSPDTQTPSMSVPCTQPLSSGLAPAYNATHSTSSVTLTHHSRRESQRRIPRVPPPAVDPDSADTRQSSQPVEHLHTVEAPPDIDEHISKDEVGDEHARNAAAALEISRELEALSSAAPPPLPHSSLNERQPLQEQSATPSRPSISPVQALQQSQAHTQYHSLPPSPLAPPSAPFAHRSVSPVRPSPSSIERPPPVYSDDRTSTSGAGSRGSSPFSSTPPSRLPQVDTLDAGNSGSPGQRSPLYRTPPEYPRPAPPFSSPSMAKSTSSLNGAVGGGSTPRTISAAAFRRQQQQGRSPSSGGMGDSPTAGPADTSPLVLRRQSPGPALPPKSSMSTRRLSVVNPDPHAASDEDGEFDYIAAYGGSSGEGEQAKSGHGDGHRRSESMATSGGGYAAGKYVSEL